MPLSPEQEHLAKNCYGYGRWDAPYWFIGAEQGQDKNEDGIEDRYRAFIDLQKHGLCDCRKFHEQIRGNGLYIEDIHGNVPLQFTWNYHMALLYGYWGKPCKPRIRRSFQRDEWGSADGQICIAELRGLPARSNRERVDQSAYIPERVSFLKEKIGNHSPAPEFVVFYGTTDEQYWNAIAPGTLILNGITKHAKTLFAYMPHLNAQGELKKSHAHWRRMGEKLCEEHKKL